MIIIFTYIVGFGIGNGSITWLYMADILPDIGISFASAILWLFTVLVGIGFPWIKNTFSLTIAFLTFLVFTILGLFFVLIFVKETKGKK